MKWHFSPLPRDQVETEVTQRDQFDNDDVDISETIVRESIQNSLDAKPDDAPLTDPVRVSFRWVDSKDGLDPLFFKNLFLGHRDHAEAAELSYEECDFGNPSALIIEDFGTSGLTGDISVHDDGNFCDFWRRHGKSHKSGKSRGRWGLGKLVYSCSSDLGVFFGATSRAGEDRVLVMGQTVLNLRWVNEQRYPPHAFFCDIEGEGSNANPVPIGNDQFVHEFSRNFSLERKENPGLSIVIPFPRDRFSREKMIEVAIANYFYPLITGQLVLNFGGTQIDSSNVRLFAKDYAASRFQQLDLLFDFIEEVYRKEQTDLLQLKPSWCADKKLDESDFDPETLEEIRRQFESGDTVGVYLPITISRKNGESVESGFSVYIKRPEELDRGLDLYVRGGLTLPSEGKMGDRRAMGAMIAEHEVICSFLGDAENAAHTKWITNTEKLKRNWRNAQSIVPLIKKSIIQLYDLLAEVAEEEDKEALQEFFWFDEPKEGKGRKKKKKSMPVSIPKLPRPEPLWRLDQNPNGFTLVTTERLTQELLPKELKIKVAYEVTSGNAFKKYSEHDFKLGKGDIACRISEGKANVISGGKNVLEIEITEVPFRLKVDGFDPNRDLKVNVR